MVKKTIKVESKIKEIPQAAIIKKLTSKGSLGMATVKIQGITSLLHNKLTCGVVEGSFETTKVKGKGQVRKDPREEALRVLFVNSKGKVFHPANHLEGVMGSAAAEHVFKGNKTWKSIFKSGIVVTPVEIPLSKKWVIDTRPEWVGRFPNNFPQERFRPRFDTWDLKFNVEILDERITLDYVKAMLMQGGAHYGIGDRRTKGLGKFEVISFKPSKVTA